MVLIPRSRAPTAAARARRNVQNVVARVEDSWVEFGLQQENRNYFEEDRDNMQLRISRNQAAGMFGGVKFELKAQVQLTPAEAALVGKYKADKEVLLKKEIKIPFTGKAIVLDLTIGSLMAGQTFKCNDIAEILEYQENVKQSCEAFRKYLSVMETFGGEEVIEYAAEGAKAATA